MEFSDKELAAATKSYCRSHLVGRGGGLWEGLQGDITAVHDCSNQGAYSGIKLVVEECFHSCSNKCIMLLIKKKRVL